MANLHKVLIVAYRDDSMESAYEVVSRLREFGYSSDLCHINLDEAPSNIKAIQVLNDEMNLSSYEAVVFLDDGGDYETAVALAKTAIEKELVIGGHGEGMLILSKAGALKDSFICHGLDDKHTEGAQVVQSPSVRDDKVVTSMEGCATGFAVLLVDALGGKIKHIVRATNVRIPRDCALVVSPIEKWSDFWPLASDLRSRGSGLVVAGWNDIDIKTRRVNMCAFLDVDANDIHLLNDQPLPYSSLVRDASLSPQGTADAIEQLELAGCTNINSSKSIRRLMRDDIPEIIASVSDRVSKVFNGNEIDEAIKMISTGGTWDLTNKPDGTYKHPIRIASHGDSTIVSRKMAGRRTHVVTPRNALKPVISRAFNRGGFVLSSVANPPRLGHIPFELTWIMRRGPDGWRVANRIAAAGDMTCYANEVIRLIFPDEWGPLLQDADIAAEIVSIVLQSLMDNPDDISEMGMSIMFAGSTPIVTNVSAIIDPDIESRVSKDRRSLKKMAQSLCLPYEGDEQEPSDADEIASALSARSGDPVHRKIIERELANERIWVQPSGQIAMQTCDGIEKLQGMEDLVRTLKDQAVSDLEEEIDASRYGDKFRTNMASRASKRSRHRLRLALEMAHLLAKDSIKMAGIYPSSIAGPYAHLELPMQERVFEWREGDDWLTDREQAISSQPRYHPEYEKAGAMGSDEGFYFVWDEPNRSPTDWLNVMRGDTIYKTRNLLSPGKMY